MNTIYKLVWNASTRSFVAASELAKGRKKTHESRRSLSLLATAAALVLCTNSVLAGESCKLFDSQAGVIDETGTCIAVSDIPAHSGRAGILAYANLGTGNSTGGGNDVITIGTQVSVTGNDSIGIGSQLTIDAANVIALGTNGVTVDSGSAGSFLVAPNNKGGVSNSSNAVAILGHATNADSAVAIGDSATAAAGAAIALGQNANATAQSAVALGADSIANRANTVSVGSSTAQRQVVNMAAGTQATDAVNISQLAPVVTALGGGAAIDATTGAVTGPSYALSNGGAQITVGGALSALDGALSTANTNITNNATSITNLQQQLGEVAAGGVQYDDPATRNQVTLGGTGASSAVKLTNVANGAISMGSTDAVNGSQLYNLSDTLVTALGGGAMLNPDGSVVLPAYQVGGTTQHSISDAFQNIDGRVTQNTSDIADLADQIGSGTLGLVQQSAPGANLTVGANTDGAAVDFTGTAGARTLTGVAAGAVHASSTDAVNGSQLFGSASSVANALGGGSTVNADGTVSAPSYSVGGSTVNNVGDAITNLDGRVTQNTGDIADLGDQINRGTVGLVQQAAPGANLTVGAHTDGRAVDFTGSSGTRVLTGVANGVGNTDAVSLGQLKSALGYDPDDSLAPLLAVRYDDATLASASLGGTAGTVLNNVAPGLIEAGSMQAVNGGQLYSMQQNFQGQIDWLTGQVGDLNDRVSVIEQGAANPPPAPDPGNGGTPGYGPGPGTGDNSLVVGTGAQASGSNSSAIGAGATASGNNSVALGTGSVADRDNTVSVGSEGHERQITNVAAGTQRTDAANWGQVQDAVNDVRDWANQKFHNVDRRINRMGAMSAAYGQMAFSANGLETRNRLGVGVGTQGGQSAIAVGYSRQLKPNMNLSFGGSASAGDVSMGAGLSVGW